MALQTKLPLSAPALGIAEPREHVSEPETTPFEPAPIWLQRLSLGVLVVFCLYLGGILVYLPWWRPMWDDNSLLLDFPRLHHWLLQGPVRGLISGIGLLDLWIGISEIIHYREYRA